MQNKIESIAITNPANGCSDKEIPTVTQMKQDALFYIASLAKQELENQENSRSWPLMWEHMIDDGKDKLMRVSLMIGMYSKSDSKDYITRLKKLN